MYKVIYYRGRSKIFGEENWYKFEAIYSDKSRVNDFVRREQVFDKISFQTFVAAVDVIKDDEVVAYGRLSYSGEGDRHKSCLWEGKDLDGNLFNFTRPGTDLVTVYTPFLIGERL